MPDWLMKILSSIVSVKTAAIALVTALGLVVFWREGGQFIVSRGIQPEYSRIFLVVILYSTSHLIVDSFYRCSIWLVNLRIKHNESKAKKAEQEVFRIKVRKAIPKLPRQQIELLTQLRESERAIDITNNGVIYLEKQKFITRLYKISSSSVIFEINIIVSYELANFLSEQRKKQLSDFIDNIAADEKYFLELFFSEGITEGTGESGKMMKSEVFRSAQGMVRKGILQYITSKKPDVEAFKLELDAIEMLESRIFDKKHVRKEVFLNANFLLGNGGGSGATGSYGNSKLLPIC